MRRLLRFRRPNAPAFVVATIVVTTTALIVGSVARSAPAPPKTVVPRGSSSGRTPVVAPPVTAGQMAGAVAVYRTYVTRQLLLESDQVRALETAIGTGQLTAARAAWLTAHLTWHRIGGAYDAFGNLTLAIDGTSDRLRDGAASPQFTGFHKVETDLWQTDDLTAAAADTATVLGDIDELALAFPRETVGATELPLRTHEILEDALRDELSGADDDGSGTDLASVGADVDGTRELLTVLAPFLDRRAPDLVATVSTELNTVGVALTATESHGRWVAVAAVPLKLREQVDGAVDTALETLAAVPGLLPVVGATT